MKPPTKWMSTVSYIEKSRDELNIFHAIMVPNMCNPIFYMSATMYCGKMVPQDYIISLE